MDSTPTHEQLVISFGTPVAEADGAAVAATIHAVVSIMKEAHRHVSPSSTLVIKARPLASGSLEIPLNLEIAGMIGTGALFVAANLEQINAALTIVKQYFELRILMRGNPLPEPNPQGGIQVGPIHVTNNSGTINLWVNPVIGKAVSDAAEAIESDPKIENLALYQGEDTRVKLVEVGRDELQYLRSDSASLGVDVPAKRQRKPKATLVVRSPDLIGDSKWAFNYRDHRIEASMDDKSFLAEVRSGNRTFTAGTQLIVDLQIDEEYDLPNAAYLPKKYAVLKVHELVRQKKLPSTSSTRKKGKGNRGK
jgi:hypothetical protein